MTAAADDEARGSEIAIIGMAGRFPRAASVDELWVNLQAGRECITFFSDAELQHAGVSADLSGDPSYVKARGVLADADRFDAPFFGVSPREAELTDPQQRIFLECAWTALEHAGIRAETYPGRIGVYAGAGWSSYLLFNLASDRSLLASAAGHQTLLGNDKDHLTTRVSYKLGLTGPSVGVQTACSSSLVAVGLACQSLLHYQCDVALAGGVSIAVPQTGHLYRPGGILSPDGHCRAFDRDARGTVLGSGAGIVVLKRLDAALEDGDHILAVIKAAAINNDGARKPGYTAPSVEGQAEAILDAQMIAGVSAESIGYIETHGTGTVLGDPIEIAALDAAFRRRTDRRGFCAIGSLKTNIGHLDAAAGVAGVIKTVLALAHEKIPPSLNYESSNPQIDFASSPFYVNTALVPWPRGGAPRRAAVSSFGLGGTNAHVIVEEAPARERSKPSTRSPQALVLSARTLAALERVAHNLAAHLRADTTLDLADVAYTLQTGRQPFEYRRALVCESADEAIAGLEASCAGAPGAIRAKSTPRVAFVFCGDAPYLDMARGLYETEPAFRTHADACVQALGDRLGVALSSILYPDYRDPSSVARLARPTYADAALFAVEYALAQTWRSYGIAIDEAIGWGAGEYVAAAVDGTLSFDEAVARLIARAPASDDSHETAERLRALMTGASDAIVEIGPGGSLARALERERIAMNGGLVLPSLPDDHQPGADQRVFRTALASLWLTGANVEWRAGHEGTRRNRVPLPTYPFERRRYWIDPVPATATFTEDVAAGVLAACTDTTRHLARQAVGDLDRAAFVTRRLQLDALARAYMSRALDALGFFTSSSTSIDAAFDRVRSSDRPLVEDWLRILHDAGDIRRDGDGWIGSASDETTTLDVMRAAVARVWVDAPHLVDLTERCGRALADVAQGVEDPTALFLPATEWDPDVVSSDVFVDVRFRTLLRSVMARVAERTPGRMLRVLEVGGGTGVGTAAVLPVLPRDRTQYMFTDVVKSFLLQARRRFADYPFVDYGVLDIERSPQEQGYAPGSYDLVLAVNALHVTRDVAQTLANLRSLVAHDGLLVAWEITRATCDFAMTYGLMMNQPLDGGRSRGNPFLSAGQWRRVLTEQQFNQVVVEPNDDLLGQHVIVACVGATAASSQRAFSVPSPRAKSEEPVARPSLNKHVDVADWFHVPAWKRDPRVKTERPDAGASGRWLILLDAEGWGAGLAERLRASGSQVITVASGDRVVCGRRDAWTLPATDPAGSSHLLRVLASEERWPDHIVYARSLVAPSADRTVQHDPHVASSIAYDLVRLAQAIGECGRTHPLTISILSAGAHDVTGTESIDPATATILGPCRVIPLEYSHVTCRNVDIDDAWLRQSPGATAITRLLDELRRRTDEPIVALRGAHRWVQSLDAVRLARPLADMKIVAKERAVYLVTGGLGRIGLTLAEGIARTAPSTFVLVGRSPFPSRAEWPQLVGSERPDERLVSKIKAVQQIEALGSSVIVACADVTDSQAMRSAIARVRQQVGRIDAVIHAAGMLGDRSIQLHPLDHFERVLAPKVAGTLLLESLLEDDPPDLFLVFSSLSTRKPGFGQAAYAAANAFLEALVHARARQSDRFRCISWDVWQGDGMAYDAAAPLRLRQLRDEDFARRGILPDEGVDAFRRAVSSGLPHVLVCTSDYLSIRSSDERDVPRMYLAALEEAHHAVGKHERPIVEAPEVEPRSSTEQMLAEAWRDVLGVDTVGIDDDFFDLGGDSLIATQLIARARTAFGVKLSSRFIYDHSTVRSMAQMVEDLLVNQAGAAQADSSIGRLPAEAKR